MRKGRDGKRKEKNGVFSGHYVIASSLPPERLRPNDDRWNAARSCQLTIANWESVCQRFSQSVRLQDDKLASQLKIKDAYL